MSVQRYLSYLKYVFLHIHYVRMACWQRGLVWQGLIHDLSKFLPSELIPYARHFYNKDGTKRKRRDKTGYYKPTDTGDDAFDFAWLLHQKRNRHHWQWWVLPKDKGGVKVLDMPEKYWKEMICDWVGAGKAQGFVSPKDDPFLETRQWYSKNKDKMILSSDTRRNVEKYIGWED